MNAQALLLWLHRLPTERSSLSVAVLQALAHIANGCDHSADLAQLMGEEGKPLPSSTVSRIVTTLMGESRWRGGRWVHSPVEPLVKASKHPHRKGMRLTLTQAGHQLFTPCALNK